MTLLKTVFCIFLVFSLNACQPTQSATSKVDANDFASFWIWGDIQTAPYLVHAKELYILQGEIRYSKSKQISTFTPQSVSILKLPHQKIWLVFRTHHLAWNEQNYQTILNRLEHWRNQGNQVQGIQIDFDSRTHDLKEYALFLESFRKRLPPSYQLSITGLLDWTNFKDQKTLTILRNNISELVIQTYQGTTTIPNYPQYLKRISAMQLPYKVGLVQHGTWFGNSTKQKDPYFKGYVVFLLRSKA